MTGGSANRPDGGADRADRDARDDRDDRAVSGGYRQGVLGFDLDPAPRLSRDSFTVSAANRQAVALLDAWPGWTAPFLNLVGPDGSGKSHLARIWAGRAGARFIDVGGLAEVAAGQCAVVEDIEALTEPQQQALFHLYNRLVAGGSLLLVSRQPLSRLSVTTPDLQSRLRAVPVVEIDAPDDALLQAVLRKRFDDRQIGVEQAVIDYILSRMDRSFSALEAVVQHLDARALAEQRAVTVPLARDVLAALEAQRDDSQFALDL